MNTVHYDKETGEFYILCGRERVTVTYEQIDQARLPLPSDEGGEWERQGEWERHTYRGRANFGGSVGY